MSDLLSGLIIEVPAAEAAVGELRMRLDPVASLGVPAHVTALFPFVAPESIDAEVRERIAVVARACEPFEYVFSRTAWFGGDEVLYLAPEDPGPFRNLTEQLSSAFPNYPPYGGQFIDVVPHLTIGEGAGRAALLEAQGLVRGFGPITGRAERLTLMAQDLDGRWRCRGRWTLGKGVGPAPLP
ncbi:MAG TPA: 2'-5' RNA ligase family protein [Propionicimonas sp.]|jgi:2'-5' RNA ligase